MKNLHFACVIWFLSLTLLAGCSLAFDKVETDATLTPELAVPLLETQMRLDKLMEGLGANSYLQVNNDGTFKMQYRGTFAESPSFNILSALPASIVIPLVNEKTVAPFPSPVGMEIDSIDLKKGIFKWQISNPHAIDLEINLVVKELTNADGVFETTFLLPANLSDLGGEIDLNGWRLKSTAGKIVLECKATNNNNKYSVSGNYEFKNLEPKKIIGYMGQKTLSINEQSLGFDFFKKWSQQGEVRFLEPQLTLTFSNAIGVPMFVKTRIAEATKTDGTKVVFDSPLTTGINIAYPSLSEMGSAKTQSLIVKTTNSNIADVLNAYPTSLTFALDTYLNPDAGKKTVGHIIDTAKVKFKMDMDIPLLATVKNFVVLDTLDVDLSKFNQITNAEFKVITDNSLPLDMGLQAYFLAADKTVIDSLVTNSALILKSAPTFRGTVVGVTTSTNLINMAAEKFSKIQGAKKIAIKYIMSTAVSGSEPVILKADQKFSLRLGVKTSVKL